MPLTIVVAAVAALAILLIAVGIASSGGGTGVSARLERYASGRRTRPRRPRAAASLGDLISQSAAISQLNKVVEQRDFGANLARDLARADLQAEGQRVPVHLGRRHRRRPGRHVPRRLRPPGAPEPDPPPRRAPSSASSCPRWYVRRRQGKRLNAFNKQLPDTITLIANALRAGSSFLQAIELVVREARPPISTEFGRVIREVNLGLPVRAGPGEHGPPRAVGRPGADGHRHLHPAPGRRQPRRDPRLDRLHHPRAGPHQGRDPDPDGPAADVGLRRRRSCRSAWPASCSSSPRASWSPMFDPDGDLLGHPGGDHPVAIGGFMMFIGFMIIRRIVDIEV